MDSHKSATKKDPFITSQKYFIREIHPIKTEDGHRLYVSRALVYRVLAYLHLGYQARRESFGHARGHFFETTQASHDEGACAEFEQSAESVLETIAHGGPSP